MLFIVLVIFGVFNTSLAKNFVSSLDQANIFYQRSLRLGYSEEIPMDEVDNFVDKTDVKVIIHGYLGNRGHSAIVPVRNAYLSRGVDNVFMADWERAASYDYGTSRALIVKVALRFSQILSEFMTKNEVDPIHVHLIGHSLGAHVAGNIGRFNNGTLGRITGLDPALPLFVPQSPDGLRHDDAMFVDVIHTDHPVFGDHTPRGNADFYPNYGRTPQPGCTDADVRTFTSCSHYRAVQLYAESIGIPENFPSIPCSFLDIVFNNVGRCRRATNLNAIVMMGEYLDKSTSGQYFLITHSTPPFGLGNNSEVYRTLSFIQEP